MMTIFNYFRLLANAPCQYNPCVLFHYAVHLFFFVLKHCLTTTCYCAIMLMFSQFKMHSNIAVIVTGLQCGWLSYHHPVLARNKEILLQNVLTASEAHPAFYWAPHALSLGLKCPGHEADSPTPSRAIIVIILLYLLQYYICLQGMEREEFTFTRYEILTAVWMKNHFV